MALTHSVMTEVGSPAPAFDLPVCNPGADSFAGDGCRLDDLVGGDALVVVFTCNHCPFAVHIEDALLEVARDFQQRGVRFVGISANDARNYPADSFKNMAKRAAAKSYPFPYLYDESQEVARAYGAVCTPDIFVYDKDVKLAYRGRFDETRPGRGRATGSDLTRALELLLSTGSVAMDQQPSMGCNIKWK